MSIKFKTLEQVWKFYEVIPFTRIDYLIGRLEGTGNDKVIKELKAIKEIPLPKWIESLAKGDK